MQRQLQIRTRTLLARMGQKSRQIHHQITRSLLPLRSLPVAHLPQHWKNMHMQTAQRNQIAWWRFEGVVLPVAVGGSDIRHRDGTVFEVFGRKWWVVNDPVNTVYSVWSCIFKFSLYPYIQNLLLDREGSGGAQKICEKAVEESSGEYLYHVKSVIVSIWSL